MPRSQREGFVIGVFGGSGFYDFLEHAKEQRLATPYGSPSDMPLTGDVAGIPVAFLPRPGPGRRPRLGTRTPLLRWAQRAALALRRPLSRRHAGDRPRWHAEHRRH